MSTEGLYRDWCSAVATDRAALERARDARVGHLGDAAGQRMFANALAKFTAAVDAHVVASGCTLLH